MTLWGLDADYFGEATWEARRGLAENGIPIGAALAVNGELKATGRNRRVQSGSGVLHAEIDCLGRAGRMTAGEFRRSCLYVTLSPCLMCTGAILQFGIPRIVVGYPVNFEARRDMLLESGVEIVTVDDVSCWNLVERFIINHGNIWKEDIGVDAED